MHVLVPAVTVAAKAPDVAGREHPPSVIPRRIARA